MTFFNPLVRGEQLFTSPLCTFFQHFQHAHLQNAQKDFSCFTSVNRQSTYCSWPAIPLGSPASLCSVHARSRRTASSLKQGVRRASWTRFRPACNRPSASQALTTWKKRTFCTARANWRQADSNPALQAPLSP